MQRMLRVQCIASIPSSIHVENKRPDLSDIALFVEVAKRRSFSRAAEALGLPNSSLSRRISRLERAVGVTLLHRSSRRVELTEMGRKYFERCEKIVEDAEAAHDQLVRESSSPKGKIRMSVPVDFGLIFIAPALVEFARLYPDLTFDVDMSPRRVDLVAEHYDLAIRVGDLEDSSSLVTRRLATVEVSLYASPAYLKAAGVPLTPADLSAHSCLRMLLPEPGLPWALRDESTQVNAVGESRFSINNLSMLRELTVSGVGIGAFDAVVADADISRGRLQRVLPDWSMPPLPISLLTPGARLSSARTDVGGFPCRATSMLRLWERAGIRQNNGPYIAASVRYAARTLVLQITAVVDSVAPPSWQAVVGAACTFNGQPFEVDPPFAVKRCDSRVCAI